MPSTVPEAQQRCPWTPRSNSNRFLVRMLADERSVRAVHRLVRGAHSVIKHQDPLSDSQHDWATYSIGLDESKSRREERGVSRPRFRRVTNGGFVID